MPLENLDPALTETRTVTITLYGDKGTDFEDVLSSIEDALRSYDDTGTTLDWNIEREA